jgi:5-methylcytosine-specific restriction protein A
MSAPAFSDRDRGTSAERGYGATWRRARVNFIAANPYCTDPYGRHEGVVKATTDVDHVRAVSGPADPLFWEATNWQALCHACHAYKTARLDGGLGRLRPAGAGGIGGSK